MSLFEPLYIIFYQNGRRGLRLPLLLGKIHFNLLFADTPSRGRRCVRDYCTIRSLLVIAAVLITKCGSSAFPNRSKQLSENSPVSDLLSPTATSTPNKPLVQLDCDHQDLPLDFILSHHAKTKSAVQREDYQRIDEAILIGDQNVKTFGYFLKGLILPLLISLTLAFGYVIWKRQMKRARLAALQNALEEARLNPNGQDDNGNTTGSSPSLSSQYHRRIPTGLVSNALLSVLEARGQWNLIPGADDADDYLGEGGETARHKPFLRDKPPDYATVFDPPSYEEATMTSSNNNNAVTGRKLTFHASSGFEHEDAFVANLVSLALSGAYDNEQNAGCVEGACGGSADEHLRGQQ